MVRLVAHTMSRMLLGQVVEFWDVEDSSDVVGKAAKEHHPQVKEIQELLPTSEFRHRTYSKLSGRPIRTCTKVSSVMGVVLRKWLQHDSNHLIPAEAETDTVALPAEQPAVRNFDRMQWDLRC